jgi:tetratricopeptide (TPR) repeat protein
MRYLFLLSLIFGAPATIAGFLAVMFDWRMLDFPGLYAFLVVVSTLGAIAMGLTVFVGGNWCLVLFMAPYYAMFLPFFYISASRFTSYLVARHQEARMPRCPFEDALLAERQHRVREAEELYRDYLGENGDDEEALRRYSQCLVKMSRFDEAVAAQERVYKIAKSAAKIAAALESAYIMEVHLQDAEGARRRVELLRRDLESTGLDEALEEALTAHRIRVTGDPTPFEDKIDLV